MMSAEPKIVDELRLERIRDYVSERPRIEVSHDVADVVDQAQSALLEAGKIYVRGAMLVHIVRDYSGLKWLRVAAGTPMICQALNDWLWERMSSSAKWMKLDRRGEKWVESKPPAWAPKVLAARKEWTFPVLDGCSDMPVLRPDGTIHIEPGYDVGSRTFFAPGETWPRIKSEPTRQDARAALAELLEPFGGFPFVADSDRYAVVAFILSIIARSAIDGPVPAFKFGANTPGSGKGLCADVAAIIATGSETSKMAHTPNEEETRKRVFALAISAPAVVMVDNIEGTFGGPTWAMLLTAGQITDRVLGVSEDRTVPVRSVICLTGNNIQFVGDTGRRIIPIDLDPKCEHPQDRKGFRHPDVKGYVSANRVRLASSALTLLRGYFGAGQPQHDKPQYGSFERWDRVVRGALIWAGGIDVLDGVKRLRFEGHDHDAERLRALTSAWYAVLKDQPTTLHELLSTHAVASPDLRCALDAFAVKGEPLTTTLLGKRLALYRGRIVDSRRIEHAEGGHGGVKRWQVLVT